MAKVAQYKGEDSRQEGNLHVAAPRPAAPACSWLHGSHVFSEDLQSSRQAVDNRPTSAHCTWSMLFQPVKTVLSALGHAAVTDGFGRNKAALVLIS